MSSVSAVYNPAPSGTTSDRQAKPVSAKGPVAFLLPLRGVSILDGDGEQFCDRDADAALFAAIRENLNDNIPVVEMDNNINDPEFSARAVEMMVELLTRKKRGPA